jgi:LPS-assembly protein
MSGLTVGGAAPEVTVPWVRPNPLRTQCQEQPQAREIVTWELRQKYFLDPTFGGALIAGQRNMFTTTADLTGIAFVTQPRHLSPLISRLRVETSAHTDAEWDLDYDFQGNGVNSSVLLANYHLGPVTVGGGDANLNIPAQTVTSGAATLPRFNQFRAAIGYGRANKRGFSGAGSFGFDAESGQLQFIAAQTTYNWDCCGMTAEYRSYSVANVRHENLFRFTFTLADIAAFGSLRRQERLY